MFVKFIKTTLGAEARLKIAEILLRLGLNKRGLTLQVERNKDFSAARNISKQGLALCSTGVITCFYIAAIVTNRYWRLFPHG
jgi:hypothetical protein